MIDSGHDKKTVHDFLVKDPGKSSNLFSPLEPGKMSRGR